MLVKRSSLFFNQKVMLEKNTVACLLAKKVFQGKHTSLFPGKHTSLFHEKKGLLGKNTRLFLA
jgi:hypothetical protein